MNQPKIKHIGISEVQFGKNVTIVSPVNLYGCVIGNNVFIGPFVEIQKDVKIGDRTKIQFHSFICELVDIGKDCFVAHGVTFINDLFANAGPAKRDRFLWKQTKIGDNVSIGSNTTILPVKVCSNVVIGAGSVVTKDIKEPGVYAGNPIHLIKALSNY